MIRSESREEFVLIVCLNKKQLINHILEICDTWTWAKMKTFY
jgi:hypothetical protein